MFRRAELAFLLLAAPAHALPVCETGLLVTVPDRQALALVTGVEAGLCRLRFDNGDEVLRHPALLLATPAGDSPPAPPPDQGAPDQNPPDQSKGG